MNENKFENQDIKQGLAQEEYDKENDSPDGKKYGPPSPEDYKRAEESLDWLLDCVNSEKNWGGAVDFANRAAVILAFAPMTLQRVLNAIAEGAQTKRMSENVGKEKLSFREALRKEMTEQWEVNKRLWKIGRPATDQYNELKDKYKFD